VDGGGRTEGRLKVGAPDEPASEVARIAEDRQIKGTKSSLESAGRNAEFMRRLVEG
jgi:hypothetical protein